MIEKAVVALKDEPIADDTEKVDESITDNSNLENSDEIEVSSNEITDLTDNTSTVDNDVAEKLCNVNEEFKNVQVSVETAKSSETIVHATVNFDSCLSRSLQVKDYQFVESIVSRYDHLKQNIQKIEFGACRTYVDKEKNAFNHSLAIKLFVDSSQLWQGARSYVWKFLGQDEWKKNDGTVLTVNRIHVK